MRLRYIIAICTVSLMVATVACQKTNDMPKLPHISLMSFGPDSITVNIDTALLEFHLSDGSAALGNDPSGTRYDIYIKDSRFDTGYAGYFFPAIDHSIENASKGIEGTCYFQFTPAIISIRSDSIHQKYGDTASFELYIEDRLADTSNHIKFGPLYLHP